VRRRAVVLISDEDIASMLALDEGERIHSFWPDQERFGIMVGIEGEHLAQVADMAQAPRVHRTLMMEALRRQVAELRDAWRRGDYADADGPERYLATLNDILDKALRV
jgi:hypothetical protein